MNKFLSIRLFEFFVFVGLCTAIYFSVSPEYFSVADKAEFMFFQRQYYTLKAACRYFQVKHNGFAVDPNFDDRKFDITDTNYEDEIAGIEKYIDVKKNLYFLKNGNIGGKFVLTVDLFTGNRRDFKEVDIVAVSHNELSNKKIQLIIDDSNGVEDEWEILKDH